MFIVIVGGGKVGTYLARGLIAQDHEIVVIEKDARKAQYLVNMVETDIAIVGDGCDPRILGQAGIGRADAVVADTGDDEDNLVVCLLAKRLSQAKCIARVNNPRNKAIFESIDRERPIALISSTEIILDVINDKVHAEDYSIVTTLHDGDLELVRVPITVQSPASGKKIGDLSIPAGAIAVAIERDAGGVDVPNGETVVLPGDQIVMMLKRGLRDVICANLGGKRSA